jgi:hypothetical protein
VPFVPYLRPVECAKAQEYRKNQHLTSPGTAVTVQTLVFEIMVDTLALRVSLPGTRQPAHLASF